MDRLLEYATRHPLLVGGTVLLALVAAAYEFSRARGGGQAVGPTDAVRLLNQGAVWWTCAPRPSSTPGTSSTRGTCRRKTWPRPAKR